MALYHVNFHTLSSKPIFEQDHYDRHIRNSLQHALRRHQIVCSAWEVMPTHVHMIIHDFPDQLRATILNYVKGSTSRAFFEAFPQLRSDLMGGHLWTKGYFFVEIATHRQFLATLQYVRTNRLRADLSPPAPLERAP